MKQATITALCGLPVDDGGWDKITGWVSPRFIGPFSDEAAMVQFRTKDRLVPLFWSTSLFPTDNVHGLLGNETQNWKEVHSASFFLLVQATCGAGFLAKTPLMQLSKDALEFGAGGAAASDVYLKRVADEVFEVKAARVQPAGDDVAELGSAEKRFKSLYVAGAGRVGWLNVDAYTVITNTRVLQNVTADAAVITSGRFPLARFPEGASGYVLEAQGTGVDAMYVNRRTLYSCRTQSRCGGHHKRNHR